MFIISSVFILIIYSPTIILEIPFFKISHLEINVKDAAIKQIIKETLNKNFANNWFLLKLNESKFNKLLEKKSGFYIENVKIQSFNFLKGSLKLVINLNSPYFILNNRFFISKNGRIFLYPHLNMENVPILIDISRSWKVGQVYPKGVLKKITLLKDLYSLNYLKNNHKILIGKGEKYRIVFNLRTNIDRAYQVKNFLEKVEYIKHKLSLNILGKKSFAVKIYKE